MQNILKPRQNRQRENEILYFERLITKLVTKHPFPPGFCRPQKILSANSNTDELRMENTQLLLKIQPKQGQRNPSQLPVFGNASEELQSIWKVVIRDICLIALLILFVYWKPLTKLNINVIFCKTSQQA